MKSTSFTNIRNRRKVYGIVGALLTLAIPFAIMWFDGANLEEKQSFCPFKMLTGFPCPGCGITKSLVFLYEGNIEKSLHYNLFGPLAVMFCVVTIVVLSLELITKKEYLNSLLYSKKLAYVLGFALGGYHLVRVILFVAQNNIDSILQQSIWR